MKQNWLSFALIFSLSAGALRALDIPFNDAVPESLSSRPLRLQADPSVAYFLPGSGSPFGADAPDREIAPFSDLDARSDWQREELQGRPRKRIDFYLGGTIPQSEVEYDARGRRTVERVLERDGAVRFVRHYDYDGPGPFPVLISAANAEGASFGSTVLTLDARGWPLHEEQTDSQGLPLRSRSYCYDDLGHLLQFSSSSHGALSGLFMSWQRGERGLPVDRHYYGRGLFLESGLYTHWAWDAQGRVERREEWQEELALPAGSFRTVPGRDPRRRFIYRVSYRDTLDGMREQRRFRYELRDQGSDDFYVTRTAMALSPEGWVTQSIVYDKDSQFVERHIYERDAAGNLQRIETWKKDKDPASEAWVYEYDYGGNWIRRSRFAATGDQINDVQERKFDYSDPQP